MQKVFANSHYYRVATIIFLLATLAGCAPKEETGAPTSSANDYQLTSELEPQIIEQRGTTAAPRTTEYDWMSVERWNQMHAEDVAIAADGGVDLLFIGDSITEGWNSELWGKYFAPFNAANFGIGGDHTGNLLWRLENGATGTLQPKVVVLLIGVNNFGHLNETPEQVFAGVTAVVNALQTAFPAAQILVNGVFPYGQAADTPERAQVAELNKLLSTLNEREQVVFEDHGHLLLQDDDTISAETMSDYLHLTEKGYEIWAEAMLPRLYAWLDPESADRAP